MATPNRLPRLTLTDAEKVALAMLSGACAQATMYTRSSLLTALGSLLVSFAEGRPEEGAEYLMRARQNREGA